MTILQIGIEWFDKGNKLFPFWNLSIHLLYILHFYYIFEDYILQFHAKP